MPTHAIAATCRDTLLATRDREARLAMLWISYAGQMARPNREDYLRVADDHIALAREANAALERLAEQDRRDKFADEFTIYNPGSVA